MTDAIIYNSSISGHMPFNATGNIQAKNNKSVKPRICKLQSYEYDVRLVNSSLNLESRKKKIVGCSRGRIRELSAKSRNNLVFTARNLTNISYWIVLTYPDQFPVDGKMLSKHLAAFRRFLVQNKVGGIWIKEFQSRGAIHINLLVNKALPPDLLKSKWYQIVGSCDPAHAEHGLWIEKIRDLQKVVSYVSKLETKKVPEGITNVGRFWSKFGVMLKPKLEIEGELNEIISIFSECLNYENEQRQNAGYYPREYSGLYSFVSYGSAKLLERLVLARSQKIILRSYATLSVLHFVFLIKEPLQERLRMMTALYTVRNRMFWQRWRDTLLPHRNHKRRHINEKQAEHTLLVISVQA